MSQPDDKRPLSLPSRRLKWRPPDTSTAPVRVQQPAPSITTEAIAEAYEEIFKQLPPAPRPSAPAGPVPRDGHYKEIRRSHKGKPLSARTWSDLYKLRQEESALQRKYALDIKSAKVEGRCTAFIMPRPSYSSQCFTREATEGYLCEEPAVERGYCSQHFITHVLYLRDRQSGKAGRGVTRRPFRADEIAIGRMSEKQKDLMSDLARLPMGTPLEECLTRLNEADPKNPLPPIVRGRKKS